MNHLVKLFEQDYENDVQKRKDQAIKWCTNIIQTQPDIPIHVSLLIALDNTQEPKSFRMDPMEEVEMLQINAKRARLSSQRDLDTWTELNAQKKKKDEPPKREPDDDEYKAVIPDPSKEPPVIVSNPAEIKGQNKKIPRHKTDDLLIDH